MPHSRVPATFLKQVFPSINQGGTTFDLARNQNVLQTLIPPSVLDVDVEMRDVVEHTQLEQLVVHGTLRGSQTGGTHSNYFVFVADPPPPNFSLTVLATTQ